MSKLSILSGKCKELNSLTHGGNGTVVGYWQWTEVDYWQHVTARCSPINDLSSFQTSEIIDLPIILRQILSSKNFANTHDYCQVFFPVGYVVKSSYNIATWRIWKCLEFSSDAFLVCQWLYGLVLDTGRHGFFLAKTNVQLRTTANRLEVQNLKRQQYLRIVFFVPIRQRMETCSKMLNSTIFNLILAILFWPSNIRFGPLTYEYIRDLAV